MSFRVICGKPLLQRAERLLIEAKSAGHLRDIKSALMQLHQIMEDDPIGLGEPAYRLKHVGLTVYVVVRQFIAVNYAVEEDRKIVYVMRFAFSGNHPYPPSFDEILNPKKS